jgi:hypothetical protein
MVVTDSIKEYPQAIEDLHSPEGPRPYEAYRDPFWQGFVQILVSNPKLSDSAKRSLEELAAQHTSEETLQKVISILWDSYLALEIVKARYDHHAQPWRDFQQAESDETTYLPPIAHPLAWVTDEIELHETAVKLIKQGHGGDLPSGLAKYIERTLAELREKRPATTQSDLPDGNQLMSGIPIPASFALPLLGGLSVGLFGQGLWSGEVGIIVSIATMFALHWTQRFLPAKSSHIRPQKMPTAFFHFLRAA